ncbi:hypothetical protein [Corallococcus exercitus]|uniref:hypothetical protein n=1 Tax=Corallococcus exercitus TaxID=2316736 RepID=UPI0035D444B7
MMNKLTSVVCLGSALVLSACGAPEPEDGVELAQQSQGVITPVSGSSQGCDFTLSGTQLTTSPPSYSVTLTRTGGTSCAYPAGESVEIGYSYSVEPRLSIAGNSLGLAVSFTKKGTYSGSSPRYLAIKHIDPATLSVVRDADLRADYPYGQITSGGITILSDGTTLRAAGQFTGTLGGRGGSYYYANYADFFTSTTAPTYSTF